VREEGENVKAREIENLQKKNKEKPIVLVSKSIAVKASVNSDGFTFTISVCCGIEM